jgi:hypothetical protein
LQVRGRSISISTTPKIDMNSTFARTEYNSSQRKRSVLSNGKSENGFVLFLLTYPVYISGNKFCVYFNYF